MIKDILLSLETYPDATREAALESAVNLASAFGASLTGLAVEVDIHLTPHVLANMVLDVQGLVQEAEGKSRDAAVALCSRLDELGRSAGIEQESQSVRCIQSRIPDVIVAHARLHDLTMFVLGSTGGPQRWHAEEAIFGSGRPVLIIPEKSAPHAAPQRVTVAWDYSRAAARALGDAMPFLRLAKAVHLVCVTDEKDVPHRNQETVRTHLRRHGIDAVYDEVNSAGRTIHDTIRGYVGETGSELLVMGAYGHSRLRQFVLGGATRGVLDDPYALTLLSH